MWVKILLTVALLSGCSYADIAKTLMGATDKGGINTDLQVGDKRVAATTQLGDTVSAPQATGKIKANTVDIKQVANNTKSTTSFSGPVEKVEVKDGNVFWIILLTLCAALFWVLPEPSKVWSSLTKWYKSTKEKIWPIEKETPKV